MTHPSDPVDPLSRALSDAEASDEAAGYTVPVALVRSRVRRRRAVRAGGTVGVAALAVVAVVVALPSLLSRTPAAGPPATPPPGVSADWPAQFDRCGKKLATVLPDVGGATLTTSVGTLDEPNQAIALMTTMTGPDGVDAGWVYGTELSWVDDDGTIIGVQEGPSVPAIDDIDEYYAGTDFASVPFPIKDHAKIPFVSCGQYPAGSGALALETGAYHLWVTQTIGYQRGSTSQVARTSTDVPVALLAPAKVITADEYFACGKAVALTIQSMPDAGNLVLAADLPGGDPHEWSATVGTSGADGASASLPPAASYAIVDEGRVIGFVVPGSGSPAEHEIARDGTVRLDGPVFEVGCQGDGVATAAGAEEGFHGTYTVWPYVVATPLSGGSPVVVVANPQTVMLGP